MARATGATKRMTATQIAGIPKRILLKKNDVVKVIAGRDKGKTGRIIDVFKETGRVLVEHVGMTKKHTRPNPAKQIQGGIAESESPIHVSNVTLLTKDGKPTRIGMKLEQVSGKTRRTRIARSTGEVLDKKK